MRDEFPADIKRAIADRVGNLCSFPNCGALTSGPQLDTTKAIKIGVAAHIMAASPGGPRYDASMVPEHRRHADNGIWLCATHGALVDKDEDRYSVSILREWKVRAEELALARIGKPAEAPAAHFMHHGFCWRLSPKFFSVASGSRAPYNNRELDEVVHGPFCPMCGLHLVKSAGFLVSSVAETVRNPCACGWRNDNTPLVKDRYELQREVYMEAQRRLNTQGLDAFVPGPCPDTRLGSR